MGGLGNQLFQFGAGLSLAGRLGVPLSLLSREGLGWPSRLHTWNIPSRSSLQVWDSLPGFRVRVGLERTATSILRRHPKHFFEKNIGYDPDFENIHTGVHLHGYFQSYRYLEPVEHEIKCRLLSSTITQSARTRWRELGLPEKYIGVHVRGGDYLKLRSVYAEASQDYYKNAIGEILDQKPTVEIICFTDDRSYAEGLVPEASFFVDPKVISEDSTNLLALSFAEGIVGANSTFSWFAAWLSDCDRDSKVFPAKWFNDPQLQAHLDLLPPWFSRTK